MASRVDWNLRANWDLFYGQTDSATGAVAGYGRDWATDFGRHGLDEPGTSLNVRADRLLAGFAIVPADRILIVGSGFGFLIEVLKGRGFPNVWGIDSSSDIESRKGVEASGDTVLISEEMSGVGRIKNIMRQQTGGDEFGWIITESVLESWDDSDNTTLLNVIEGGLSTSADHAVHLVSEPPFAADVAGVLNEKTLAGWKATRPAHSFMSLDTGQVL